MRYPNIKEEELKIKVGQDFFAQFDATKKIGNIDFWIEAKIKNPKQKQLLENQPLLWAEAKTGDFDIPAMFAQLILTIGKERTFDKHLPPGFLGVFDSKKIAFVPYNSIIDIFSLNDFNWNVTPSKNDTKEFQLIKDRIEKSLEENYYLYDFLKDKKELLFFIKNNISKSTETGKILIDKNNFVPIYLRWVEHVKPHINFDWEEGRKQNILDNVFYLADLFTDDHDTIAIEDDTPISENLFVVFKNGHYEIAKENLRSLFNAHIDFIDKKPYIQFWKKYKRPPVEEFQKHIIDRRDLLVPQDIRERKGAYFTPRIWVELSQQYLTDVLGENWQDEYYVWDCAAGTGNLLAGLTNKYNIWASTLDQADVNVMYERIENGAILLKEHVFQFDFLNDDFSKLPKPLQEIINNPEKRKNLIVYINPPYAEGDSRIGKGRKNIQVSRIHDKYAKQLENANRELFTQFLIRIYYEIGGCKIGEFSKLKTLTGSHFKTFRQNFQAKLIKAFIVPAWTFDNVKGKFPIGFKIWDTNIKNHFQNIETDVYDEKGLKIGKHGFYSYSDSEYFSKWVNSFKFKNGFYLGWLARVTLNDFQSNSTINILNNKDQLALIRGIEIFDKNLLKCSICFAVRKCIEATWINDRDQFLFPNISWEDDKLFQSDCLTFTLFNNGIKSDFGTNHWIPFTEQEVNARDKFDSNFMTDFIAGKIKPETHQEDLFSSSSTINTTLTFSDEAISVFNAGRDLWKYYHQQPNCNVNASLYDIREHFQGRNEKGIMNSKSNDDTYMYLIGDLREKLKILAKKIEPKIYEHGFLKN